MTQDSIIEKIKNLLNRNLFLEEALKTRILDAPESKQQKIFEILEQMDAKQLEVLQKIIKKNPNFVGQLEHVASHKELLRLMSEEAKLHALELEEAEAELLKNLSSVA